MKHSRLVRRNNEVQVRSEQDLPPAVGGIIDLMPNTTYVWNGTVQRANQIRLNASNLLIGVDGSDDKDVYTGVLASIIATNRDFTIDNLTIVANGVGAKVFDITGSTAKMRIRDNIFIANNLGTIVGGNLLVWQGNLKTFCNQGISISGNFGKLAYVDCYSFGNLGTFTELNIPSGTFQSVLINRNNFDSIASQTGLTIDPSVIITSGLIDSNVFIGAGTHLTGISANSPIWVFRDNQGIANNNFAMPLIINNITRSLVTSGSTFVTNNVSGTVAGTLTSNMNNNTDYTGVATANTLGSVAQVRTTNFTELRTAHNPEFTAVFETTADITNLRIWAGLFPAIPTNADDQPGSCIAFRFSTVTADVGFRPVMDNGTTQTVGTAIGVVAINTQYKLKIRVDSLTNKAYFSVNGGAEQVMTLTVALSTDYGFAFHISNTANGIKTALVSRVSCSQN